MTVNNYNVQCTTTTNGLRQCTLVHVHVYIVYTCILMAVILSVGVSRDRATLDTYSRRVRGQAKSQYPPVYPVLVSVLKRGMEGEWEGER